MKFIITIIVTCFITSAFAQGKFDDPLYQQTSKSTKQTKKNVNKRVFIDPSYLTAGATSIGAGLAVIGIGNAVLQNKIQDAKDSDEIDKLSKKQKIVNYVGGGLGVLGCILSLTSIRVTYDNSYAITKKLSLKDKKQGLALVYKF